MNKTLLVQVAVVLGFIVITALIFLLPITNNKVQKPKEAAVVSFNFDQYISSVKSSLRPAQTDKINLLEKEFEKQHTAAVAQDIGKEWQALNQPGISAFYFEKAALELKTEKSYLDAAYRYFDAFKAAEDTVVRTEMVNRAIRNYKKVVELNPENLDAKSDLGVCYAEGTSNPMEGITMLRDIVAKNPNHENSQLNLGMLSVKSGQFQKALERFDKVQEINPARNDIYIFKAQTYLEMNEKEKAMEQFNLFLKNSKDEAMKENVKRYMSEIAKK